MTESEFEEILGQKDYKCIHYFTKGIWEGNMFETSWIRCRANLTIIFSWTLAATVLLYLILGIVFELGYTWINYLSLSIVTFISLVIVPNLLKSFKSIPLAALVYIILDIWVNGMIIPMKPDHNCIIVGCLILLAPAAYLMTNNLKIAIITVIITSVD